MVDKLLNHDADIDTTVHSTSISTSESSLSSLRRNATRGKGNHTPPASQLHAAAHHEAELHPEPTPNTTNPQTPTPQPQREPLPEQTGRRERAARSVFRERAAPARGTTASTTAAATSPSATPESNPEPVLSQTETQQTTTPTPHQPPETPPPPPPVNGNIANEQSHEHLNLPPTPLPAPAPRKKTPSEASRERDIWSMIRKIQRDEQDKIRTRIEEKTLNEVKQLKLSHERSNMTMPTFFTAHISPNMSNNNQISDLGDFGDQMGRKM